MQCKIRIRFSNGKEVKLTCTKGIKKTPTMWDTIILAYSVFTRISLYIILLSEIHFRTVPNIIRIEGTIFVQKSFLFPVEVPRRYNTFKNRFNLYAIYFTFFRDCTAEGNCSVAPFFLALLSVVRGSLTRRVDDARARGSRLLRPYVVRMYTYVQPG